MEKNNTVSPTLNVTNNDNIGMTTSKASKPTKCILKKYSTTLTFLESNTLNEESKSKIKYVTTNMKNIFPTTKPATTDPQPKELNTSISETTKETIPDVLRPNTNDEILITIGQPVRSTIW